MEIAHQYSIRKWAGMEVPIWLNSHVLNLGRETEKQDSPGMVFPEHGLSNTVDSGKLV